ncbi:hypothetical protein [Spirillospora sp. CA-128828]|uniref:hypothetical protein n=1 Tax=Spirillospora sp. CA-128828 TaxID=3240033 RepID=UPI003D8A07B3
MKNPFRRSADSGTPTPAQTQTPRQEAGRELYAAATSQDGAKLSDRQVGKILEQGGTEALKKVIDDAAAKKAAEKKDNS